MFILIQLVEKHVDWGMPLCVCNGDIYKAYDETNHIRVCNALIGKQVPQWAVGPWMRDILESRSIFRVDQEAQTRLVFRTKSLLQGGPCSPSYFERRFG